MKFGSLHMALWLWLIPAVVAFNIYASRARGKALKNFASTKSLSEISGLVNAKKRKIKKALITVAVFLVLIALCRPQMGFKWQEVKRQGLDILIALDTSKSMLAEDVLPSRLERSKLAIKDLVRKLKGDRVGLIAFSGRAFLQCPLTSDYDGFMLSLDDVSTGTIPIGGTAIAKTIYTAIDSYAGGKKKHKILVIITDGEDLEGGVEKAIEKAKAADIKIFCVGIGTSAGELIPIDMGKAGRTFLKDAEGNVVKTRLVENILQDMAFKTGGMYVKASGAEFGLDLIYEQKLEKMEKEELKTKMEKRYNEKFQIPLVLAIILLILEPFIGDRKRSENDKV